MMMMMMIVGFGMPRNYGW